MAPLAGGVTADLVGVAEMAARLRSECSILPSLVDHARNCRRCVRGSHSLNRFDERGSHQVFDARDENCSTVSLDNSYKRKIL